MGYPGGKSGPGVYHRLINLMPPHATYIEPFLGGGAIMRLKRPAPYNIGVDLDAGVIADWRSRIGEASDSALANEVSVPPPISADAGESADPGPRFRFLRGDALTFLQSYPFAPHDLIYCDPPYLMETRSSGPRYRHEFTDAQHVELLSSIGELPCRVMISGYWSKLYADVLRRWNTIHYEAMTRGGMRTETLWFNFQPPVKLHDYRYLGETAHQRQDLKRQIASWTGKLARMSTLKRQALLAAIAAGVGGNDGGIH